MMPVNRREREPKSEPWPTRKGRLRRLTLIVFSVVLFAAILMAGGAESWTIVLSGNPWLYLLAFVISGIVPALSAVRLRTLVRAATDREIASWRRFFHINMTAISMGLFLPRNAALVGGKAAYLRSLGVPVLTGSGAVLMESLVDVLFLTAIIVPCGFVLLAGVGGKGFLLAVTASFAAVVAAVLWTRQRDWRTFAARLFNRVPWIRSRLSIPEGGFVPGPMRALSMAWATILIHVLMALRVYVIALAIGLEAPWLIFAAAYPFAQLGLGLAVAPGALGTLDASWLGLLLLGGLTNPEALSFTVALRACIFVFPIVWYGVSSLLTLTIPSPPSGAPLLGVDVDADAGVGV